MSDHDYASTLVKLGIALLPTIGFMLVAVTIDSMFNDGDIERRADYLFAIGLIFFASVYLYQNR